MTKPENDKEFLDEPKCEVCGHPMDEGDPKYCNYCAMTTKET